MIYEVVTYEMEPRRVPAAEAVCGDAFAELGGELPLIGAFHTEFGPLNQMVHILKYDDLTHRADSARQTGRSWPPVMAGVLHVSSEVLAPVGMSPDLRAGSFGPFYEWRRYLYPVDGLDKLLRAWERAMPMRSAIGSPVAAIWTAVFGETNALTHIWPYRSLEEREAIRREVRKTGLWPPFKLDEAEGGNGYELLRQENKLLLPASFSPLQ